MVASGATVSEPAVTALRASIMPGTIASPSVTTPVLPSQTSRRSLVALTAVVVATAIGYWASAPLRRKSSHPATPVTLLSVAPATSLATSSHPTSADASTTEIALQLTPAVRAIPQQQVNPAASVMSKRTPTSPTKASVRSVPRRVGPPPAARAQPIKKDFAEF